MLLWFRVTVILGTEVSVGSDGHAERVAALHMIEPRADRPTAITEIDPAGEDIGEPGVRLDAV